MGVLLVEGNALIANSGCGEQGSPASLLSACFEGFEKRLEVEFGVAWADGDVAPYLVNSHWKDDVDKGAFLKTGLRAIPRVELDAILTLAACTIVSHLPNECFDSYVLSESSLFVYPARIVIKTCGTTKLLEAIPKIIDSAAKVGLVPRRCKYTRGTFLFPKAQPEPHDSFAAEAKSLESYFGHLGAGGKASVLGDALKFPNWHIYTADASSVTTFPGKVVLDAVAPLYTLEMCMTKLDRTIAAQFHLAAGFESAAACTKASGIGELLPKSQVDDFLFEPCGYSMNGIEHMAHSTVHVTPEDEFSYASFETMGYGNHGRELVWKELGGRELGELVKDVAQTFKPEAFSLALHANGPAGVEGPGSWGGELPVLDDYICDGSTRQDLPGGSSIVFHTFKSLRLGGIQKEVMPLPLFEVHTKGGEITLGKKISPRAAKWPCKTIMPRQPVTKFAARDVIREYGTQAAAVVASVDPAYIGRGVGEVDKYIQKMVGDSGIEEPFYVMDLGVVLRLWKTWAVSMPRVTPYYAVKCNPDPALLALLASLGTGFDVASKAEIEAVTSIGVGAEMLIFANPCKLPSHITAAKKQHVDLTTFDSVSELKKLAKYHPEVKAVVRLRADDRGARCPLGVKYGADEEECFELLAAAKRLGVTVAGVAFHVGSGASDPQAFAGGIAVAKKLFEAGEKMGMAPMAVLDIGGGFTSKGGSGVGFAKAAAAINEALEKYFPPDSGVRIIGEPGRFFAEASASLATHVFGTRARGGGRGGDKKHCEYWINDGIYGSMNCLLYDHAVLSCRPLAIPGPERDGMGGGGRGWEGAPLRKSTVFGPTCDGLDTVLRDVWLPELECGDWLVFPRMGAYTQAAGTSFNGFDTSAITTHYVYSPPPGEDWMDQVEEDDVAPGLELRVEELTSEDSGTDDGEGIIREVGSSGSGSEDDDEEECVKVS